ncbi:aldehyde ferredoxin oxidoreductase C-terminal domain-containing protein [Halosegnis sp.]|uniref:aldehyde ferredoxin oxidoreductase C-terminal domain-containing protein n=1 Tax=Halosegnis sp. TaxID=2864959 RepID=UPI0035D43B64
MLNAVGPLLSIDVGTGETTEFEIDPMLERTVGGRALGTALAHERIPFDADPFGPENRLYLTRGPLQASRLSFTGRLSLTGLSPLTDGLLSSNAGGYLSECLAATGYAAVEFVGASDELVAVHITDETVTVESVPKLAGAHVSDISEQMTADYGLGAGHCLAIGPAGEHCVRFASAMTADSRAFGRGGLGAVLGAKNIKCVTVDGDVTPSVDLPAETVERVEQAVADSDHPMRESGTPAATEFINEEFGLPTRYFSEQAFEDVDAIGGEAIADKKYRAATCANCAFACKLPTRDEATGVETEGPEFETLYAFGANQGVSDLVDVMRANELCDELGLDTISAGVTVAAYLASKDAFGDAALARETLKKIAYREGIGDTLAEGVARCHDELGVEDWTVKRLEFAGHEGRVCHGQGLAYAVANRGADHLYAGVHGLEYDGKLPARGLEGKAETIVEQENRRAFRDSAILCEFAAATDLLGVDDYEQLFDAPADRLFAVGARCVDRERHFNNQRGYDRAADTVPYADSLPGFERERAAYYEARGWTPDGRVPEPPSAPAVSDAAD